MLHLTVDRFEEDLAVLLADDLQKLLVPRGELPSGTLEGDVLEVIFESAPWETRARESRIRELQARLLDRSGRDG